ncbi:AAA family ATPase [Ferrovum myxofaciens]|uniref:AAA family ATPase n=1 Tax=Ferrovum myxofaciens TaxID=416213 RepID=A0A8F3DVD6_9PROT|nr:AAA family ATPase [Ferrovum myxofaciens]KXW57254.1 Lon protease [Ferrovum myxofaciens]QKE39128.1 MAG: AAA family ATPase [Ferrovum myxofaciens]QWY74369.1 MAG: AAA family ATPase [Ferrovum myxofaciens]QWY77120.1 MAG: AAA family ATPase [Ferrovum myxofaciens]
MFVSESKATVKEKEQLRELVAKVLERRHNLVPLPEKEGKKWFSRTAADEIMRPQATLPVVENGMVEEEAVSTEINHKENKKESKPDSSPKAVLKTKRSKRAVRIFDQGAVAQMAANSTKSNSDLKKLWAPHLESMRQNDGYRDLPDFKLFLSKSYDPLKELFENFSPVLNFLRGEMVLNGASKPEAFRITPVLLNGPPGVGKTAFSQALAKALKLPFVKLAAGGMQHAASLTGTASHWSNSEPGEVFKLISSGKSATAILLFDEADKLSDRLDCSILPALLDLLERESARSYRDECLGLAFDASRLIVLLTSNNIEYMDAALRSRCKIFTIEKPKATQKRLVIQHEFEQINRTLLKSKRIKLDSETVDKLIRADMDVRVLISTVRASAIKAIESGGRLLTLVEIIESEKSNKKLPIGFV